jgi:iron-sulfur cluster assembly accessory protein
VDGPQQEDLVLTLDGLELFLDKASLSVLQGTEIDYVTEGVNSTVRFHNPNAKDYCGCGESFSIN